MASGLVNDGVESLRGFGQIQTALDVCHQSILRRAGPFIKPTSSQTTTPKPSKDKGSTCALSSAHNVERKRRSRGKGRKIRGLSPHPIPPVSATPRTSTPVPAEQPVFPYTYSRPQYRKAALRGLQQSQSGFGDHPHSPARVKPRADPPSTPVQGDLWDRLSTGRQQQTSRAQSRGTNPRDQGGVGHSGGSQSSSLHKRTTNQGLHKSSSGLGPPRPAPSATTTSGALAALGPGHSGQGKRQPEEQDRSVSNKVRYLYCCSIKIYHLSVCLIPCKGLSNENFIFCLL